MLEQRRLQKLGYSTLMVSLPREWVTQMNLKRGDTVTLSTDERGRLVVNPSLQVQETKTKCVISAERVDDILLGRIILGAYIAGHETLEIRTGNQEFTQGQLDVVKKTLGELIGLGIVEQGVNRLVVQSFLDPSKFPIEGLIMRLNLIVESMRDLAVKALLEERNEFAKQVLDLDVEADKVYFLATRLLLQAVQDKAIAERVGLENPKNIVGDRLVVKFLEEVGDYAQDIARSVMKVNDLRYYNMEVNKEIATLHEHVKNISRLAMHSLFKNDIIAANTAIVEYGNLAILVEKVDSDLDRKLVSVLAVATPLKSIVNSIKQTGRYYTIASETMINRSVEGNTEITELVPLS
ncbi:MAG: PhoU domain-containing protein [Nitrososphaerales archaeon]